jgi:ribosomal protein S18 acetylase RimI-like enzyme
MGWYIKNLDDDGDLHPLIYDIMARAEARQGEEGAWKTGKFLYGLLPDAEGFLAYGEESQEPCALLLYREEEIVFFYVKEEIPELSYYLAEHAFLEFKTCARFLYTTFPRWNNTIGQDLLSPHLAAFGFHQLNLVRMEARFESQGVKDYFTADFSASLREQGYTLTGFKQKLNQREFCQMLIRNPSPLVALLFKEPSQEALEWSYQYAFIDEREREKEYPAECSSVITRGGVMAGAVLCDEQGWISQVIVDHAHRGKGLAKAMVQKAARALPVLGADSMGLAVYRENPQALNWYTRAGFVEKSAHKVWGWRGEEEERE